MVSTAPYSSIPHRVRRKSLRRRRRAVTLSVLFTLVVALGVLLFLPRPVHTAGAESSVPVVAHRVVRGDNLWDLAVQYGVPGDIRVAVETIKETNHLESAMLQPGQVVLIPVPQNR